MAANTTTSAKMTKDVSITNVPAFLNFVAEKLPSLFLDYPASDLDTATAVIRSTVVRGKSLFMVIDCQGGEGTSLWKLTGLVVRYGIGQTEVTAEVQELIRQLYTNRGDFQEFDIPSTDGVARYINMVPPSSGLMLIRQLENEASARIAFQAGFEALKADGQAMRQLDGMIYRIWDGVVFTSSGVLVQGSKISKLSASRIQFNKDVLELAATLKRNNYNRNLVLHLRSNNKDDMLIAEPNQALYKHKFALLDITHGDKRIAPTQALLGPLIGVDTSFANRTTIDHGSAEEFHKAAYARLEAGENIIIRPKSLDKNSTVLILAPRNMLARGVSASVGQPATKTGLRSRINMPPSARCHTVVSGAAMFDSKIRNLEAGRDFIMCFPSREVAGMLARTEGEVTVVDVLGMIRGLYDRPQDVIGDSDIHVLYGQLMKLLPVTPSIQADSFAVLNLNIDTLDLRAHRFEQVKSSVGTLLPSPVDTYFETETEDEVDDSPVDLVINIAFNCYEFLQNIGANFPVNRSRRFIDFTVSDDMKVKMAAQYTGLDAEASARINHVMEYVVKCNVDNYLAQTGKPRSSIHVDGVRMYTVPRQD